MTYAECFAVCKKQLQEAAIEDFEFEAALLTRQFFYLTPEEWMFRRGEQAPERRVEAFYEAVKERAARRPLQYILGNWEFMGLELAVGEGVLIPRDDTEVLVRAVSEWLGKKAGDTAFFSGADLCAGSGAVSLGLCSLHADLQMMAVELSSAAFPFLVENLDGYADYDIMPVNADILNESLIGEYQSTFGFIASNPPYIESDEISLLQQEIQHEPRMALDGGLDGLFFYREITSKWKSCLKAGGLLAFEIGESQAEAVAALLKQESFQDIQVLQDLSGHDRVVMGVLPQAG